jgi:hypothetical protein
MSRLISIFLYLIVWYVVVFWLIGTWLLFPGLQPVPLLRIVLAAGFSYGLYKYGKSRGVFGSRKPSREAVRSLEEKALYQQRLKTERSEMLAKQRQLESKEKEDKERNTAADFVDLVKRPGKYAAVEKYRVGYLVEKGDDDPLLTFSISPEDDVHSRMTPKARPIEGVVFFNENYVEVEGNLLSCVEQPGEYFGREEASGYDLRRGLLVHLVLRVRDSGIDETVTVVCSSYKQPAAETDSGGYKRASLSLTKELLGFEVEIGQRLRINGDMWKRLKPSRHGDQAGYYMQTSLHNIRLVTDTPDKLTRQP